MRGLAYLLGLVAGLGLTVQVGMNAQLRKVLGSSWSAALVSFLVGTRRAVGADAGHAHRAAQRATRWPRCRSGPGSEACWARFMSPFRPSWLPRSGPPACWSWRWPGSLSMALIVDHFGWLGLAGEPDYLGAASRGSPAGRGSLADHALKPRARLRATHQGDSRPEVRAMHRYISSSIFLLLAVLLPASLVQGHDDVIGTRFVAPEGADAGDCDDNHHPCRTLQYALTQVGPRRCHQAGRRHLRSCRRGHRAPGAGQGRRARRLFGRGSLPHPECREQSHARLRRARRDAQQLHRARLHRGGCQRRCAAAHRDGQTTRAHGLRGRPRGQLPLSQHRLPGAGAARGDSHAAHQRQQPVGLRRSRRQPRIRRGRTSQRHGGGRCHGAGQPGHRRQHSRQCLVVARGEGVPGGRLRPVARIAPTPTSVPRRRAVACRSSI